MYAYVKSASTYRTTKKLTALSWSLIPDSLEDESSSVTVKGGECNSEDMGPFPHWRWQGSSRNGTPSAPLLRRLCSGTGSSARILFTPSGT